MAQWPLPPSRLLHKEISGGPLCFYKEHNIGARDGRIPRYSDSHSCVRCVAALSEGRFSIDVHKIDKKHRKNFLSFWSMVDIQGPDDCWNWHGKKTAAGKCINPLPRHWTSGREFSASRSAVWFGHGDVGRLPIKRLCDNPLCCNPLHLRVQGIPHFFHRRHLKSIDLEFSRRKLIGETSLFLTTMQDKNPTNFKSLQAQNELWIQARIAANKPISSDAMVREVINNFDSQNP